MDLPSVDWFTYVSDVHMQEENFKLQLLFNSFKKKNNKKIKAQNKQASVDFNKRMNSL